MKNRIKEVINMGVPTDNDVYLDCDVLIDVSYDREKLVNLLKENYRDIINRVIPDSYMPLHYNYNIAILNKDNSLEKGLYFLSNNFIKMLIYELNLYDYHNENNTITLEEILEKMNRSDSWDYVLDRIEELDNINNIDELAVKFPALGMIYATYLSIISAIKGRQEIAGENGIYDVEFNYILDNYNTDNLDINYLDISKYYCDYRPEVFCHNYANYFYDIVKNMEELINEFKSYEIDTSGVKVQSESLKLYISYLHFKSAFFHEDLKEKQKHIYYITSYFSEKEMRKNSDRPSIDVSDNDFRIRLTPEVLYDLYKNLLVQNPNIMSINFDCVNFSGMNLNEVNEYLEEYLENLSVNWEIIPDDINHNHLIIDKISKSGLSSKDKEVIRKRAIDLYIRKMEFFGRTDPYFRINGKNTFNGYVGYIYKNGNVILDKFFENVKTGRLSHGAAIYVMKIEDFYTLSRLSRPELVNHERVEKIVHNGDWEDRVIKYILEENDSNKTAEEVKKFIKK